MAAGRWISAAAALLIAGCEPRIGRVNASDFDQSRFQMLRDPATSREEVVCVFGEPTASYEDGRVEAYRFLLDWQNETAVVRSDESRLEDILGRQGEYHLVIVYGPEGRIARYHVVRVFP